MYIKRHLLVFAVALGLLLGVRPATQAEQQPRLVAYYTSWSIYQKGYTVPDIPADQLTHVIYAFANITEDGTCAIGDPYADLNFVLPDGEPLSGNFAQLARLKQKHPHLQTLLSVGGWTWSYNFSEMALEHDSRAQFAQSCVALMRQYGFDGLDIDWEFPVVFNGNPADSANFTLLLAQLRQQLDHQETLDNRPYLLTIAAPQTEEFYQHIELDRIHRYLDWFNLMTYTYHGGLNEVTQHHAALYPDVEATVRAYLAAGVPANKLVVGVPFYGHGWAGVADQNNGMDQPYEDIEPGSWGTGTFDYDDLKADYFDTYTRFWDEAAQAPWLYNPETQVMISYDDPAALRAKARFVQENDLGGIMIWELSYDDDAHTLVQTLYTTLLGD